MRVRLPVLGWAFLAGAASMGLLMGIGGFAGGLEPAERCVLLQEEGLPRIAGTSAERAPARLGFWCEYDRAESPNAPPIRVFHQASAQDWLTLFGFMVAAGLLAVLLAIPVRLAVLIRRARRSDSSPPSRGPSGREA